MTNFCGRLNIHTNFCGGQADYMAVKDHGTAALGHN
jgi:hypothetical protein